MNTLRTKDVLHVLSLQTPYNLLNYRSKLFKRVLDVAISFFGLLFLAPLLGCIAILIKIDSSGKVFYLSPRVGKGGKVFNMLKFRTMYRNADQILQNELLLHPEMQKEWSEYQKLKNDPRITRIGAFLREYSLDELPQLCNVLLGDMSIVGPRPVLLFQSEKYGEAIKEYIQISPGITGLWQVSGRNNTDYAHHIELDLEYIQHWSFWLDIYILMKTVKVVLSRDGAY